MTEHDREPLTCVFATAAVSLEGQGLPLCQGKQSIPAVHSIDMASLDNLAMSHTCSPLATF